MASGEIGEKIKAQRKIMIFLVPLLDPGLLTIFFLLSIHPFFFLSSGLLWILRVFLLFLSVALSQRLNVYYTPSPSLSLVSVRSINRQAWSFGGGALWRGVILSTDWLRSEIMKGKCLPEPPLVVLFFFPSLVILQLCISLYWYLLHRLCLLSLALISHWPVLMGIWISLNCLD